jgi:hypothetical protein
LVRQAGSVSSVGQTSSNQEEVVGTLQQKQLLGAVLSDTVPGSCNSGHVLKQPAVCHAFVCLLTASVTFCRAAVCWWLQRLQLSVFDEGNRGYLQLPQLHRFLEAMVPTAPMLQGMEVSCTCKTINITVEQPPACRIPCASLNVTVQDGPALPCRFNYWQYVITCRI